MVHQTDTECLLSSDIIARQAHFNGLAPSHYAPEKITGSHVRATRTKVDELGAEDHIIAGQADIGSIGEREAAADG